MSLQPADLSQFVGTWTADVGTPFSSHTFSWERAGSRLRGHWRIRAPDSTTAATGQPKLVEMEISEPWLEDDLLLFHVNGGSLVTEFRIVGRGETVVGVAVHKLTPHLVGPEHNRSIEGHRVRLTRQADPAA